MPEIPERAWLEGLWSSLAVRVVWVVDRAADVLWESSSVAEMGTEVVLWAQMLMQA